MKITLYDIPSRLPRKVWSPNTWKTRYCLNFKGLPYETEWVEFPDIEPLCNKLGIPPTIRSYAFTVPAIHDPSTGVNMGNSFDIAEYLDKRYPNTPLIFPHNTAGIQAPFEGAFRSNMKPLLNFLIPAVCHKLNPRSAEYFRRTREQTLGLKNIEDLIPKGEDRVREWAKVERGLAKANVWFSKNGGSGPFIWATPCWADFVVGGYMMWIRSILGEDSEEWKDITSWHGGRWKAFVEGLKKYEGIH